MKIKFDLVRIGKRHENFVKEDSLKQNVKLLMNNIQSLLSSENCSHKNNVEHVTMIVPGRGLSIKILLSDFKDCHIRKLVRERYPNNIYKGNKDLVYHSWNNQVFR